MPAASMVFFDYPFSGSYLRRLPHIAPIVGTRPELDTLLASKARANYACLSGYSDLFS